MYVPYFPVAASLGSVTIFNYHLMLISPPVSALPTFVTPLHGFAQFHI
jgi:hypothetical protein